MPTSKAAKERKNPKVVKQQKFLKNYLGEGFYIRLSKISGFELGAPYLLEVPDFEGKLPHDIPGIGGLTKEELDNLIEKVFNLHPRLQLHLSQVRALWEGIDHLVELTDEEKKLLKQKLHSLIQQLKCNSAWRFLLAYSMKNEFMSKDITKTMQLLENIRSKGFMDVKEDRNTMTEKELKELEKKRNEEIISQRKDSKRNLPDMSAHKPRSEKSIVPVVNSPTFTRIRPGDEKKEIEVLRKRKR